MADNTKIEWADATVNAVNGCSVLSLGCTNCYAMKLAGTRLRHHPSRAGLTDQTKAGPVWNGRVSLNVEQLLQPLRWRRPRRIFWNAHGDLFHDAVPDEWIDRVFAVCALTPQHQHLILTKRSARMRDYVEGIAERYRMRPYDLDIHLGSHGDELVPDYGGHRIDMAEWPLPNVWLGVSAEDQTRADQRIPDLLATPAAIRFISAEPLLGPVDIARMQGPGFRWMNGFSGVMHAGPATWVEYQNGINWVIVGGESGPNARPMHPDWARSLRDQCQAAGVPFFFKQWGEWRDALDAPVDFKGRSTIVDGDFMARIGKKAAGRLLDGREWNEVPA